MSKKQKPLLMILSRRWDRGGFRDRLVALPSLLPLRLMLWKEIGAWMRTTTPKAPFCSLWFTS